VERLDLTTATHRKQFNACAGPHKRSTHYRLHHHLCFPFPRQVEHQTFFGRRGRRNPRLVTSDRRARRPYSSSLLLSVWAARRQYQTRSNRVKAVASWSSSFWPSRLWWGGGDRSLGLNSRKREEGVAWEGLEGRNEQNKEIRFRRAGWTRPVQVWNRSRVRLFNAIISRNGDAWTCGGSVATASHSNIKPKSSPSHSLSHTLGHYRYARYHLR